MLSWPRFSTWNSHKVQLYGGRHDRACCLPNSTRCGTLVQTWRQARNGRTRQPQFNTTIGVYQDKHLFPLWSPRCTRKPHHRKIVQVLSLQQSPILLRDVPTSGLEQAQTHLQITYRRQEKDARRCKKTST